MSDLYLLTLKTGGINFYTEEEAEELKENDLLLIPENDGKALTQQDIFGEDYE